MPGGRETDQRRASTLSGSSSKPTKLRRKSPIYTSTEDEKEDDAAQPSVKGPTTAAHDATTTNKAQQARNNSSQSLPSDGNLRTRYNTTYLEYLTVIQRLLVQKGRLDGLLKSGSFDSSGSISDSDGDVELLPPEELEVLSANHKRLRNELQTMRDAFERQNKGTSLSD
jgi:RNA polymerase II elongation factor ELL